MNGRLPVFDYIRTYSMVCILICHFLFNWESTSGVGRWFGATFNVVFLALSAILLGMKWTENEREALPLPFLKKRIARLTWVYYPFLVMMFCFLYLISHTTFGYKDILMHIAFLPWFDKMPGFGHLWFITMIVFCYLGVYVYSHLRKFPQKLTPFLLISSAVLHYVFLAKGLPGQMISYLTIFILLFEYNDEFCKASKKIQLTFILPILLVIVTVSIVLFYYNLYETHRFIAEWIGIICAITIMSCMFSVFNRIKVQKADSITAYLSNISFEIFLVHHVFAFGPYSVVQLSKNPIIGFSLLLFISIALATTLHIVCSNLSKICSKY